MGAFSQLMRKEWVQYRSRLFVIIVVGLFIILGMPYVITNVMEIDVNKDNVAFILMFLVLTIGFWFTLMQYISSLRADIRRKEMWLHSTNSIHLLIGAKMIYTVLTFLVFTMIITIVGLYSSQGILEGDFGKYSSSFALICLVSFLFQCIFVVIANFTFVFNLQFKRYVGKFSTFLTAIAVVACFVMLIKLIENPIYGLLLEHGEISMEFLAAYTLTINQTGATVRFGSIYIVEDIFSWITYILLFIVSNKWLEKVVTR